MNSTKAAANRSDREGAKRNLASISPFFIVKDLQASIAYYTDRLGFQLDFEGPVDDPYYARVNRDGIGIMLKAILPDVLPCPNHTRHEWARWDASIYTLDPDALFDEFSQRGVSFVKHLSFIDEGLWASSSRMPTGAFLPFFRSATSRVLRSIAGKHPNGADAPLPAFALGILSPAARR
jgi:catechol 2,3-dioxygenase-like lactoylglutathione lyase family enzyme